MAPKLTVGQQDALDALKEDVIALAQKKGWRTTERMGVNKSFAYCDLEHELEEGRLQVFLAVDPDSREDKFIYDSTIITGPQAFDVLRNPGLEPGDEGYEAPPAAAEEGVADALVPPTDAAHSAAHQGSDMPPTSTDAMPPTGGADTDAAHSAMDMPPTDDTNAAHARNVLADREGDYSQQDVIGIAKSGTENMRSSYSDLTDDELLTRVDGREVRWHNAFANRPESATVKAAASSPKHPPRITGTVTADGVDLRILHFIEVGSGFRSLAVGRLESIG